MAYKQQNKLATCVQKSVSKSMLPPRPSTADISTYLSYHALHHLSGREYHGWVQAQADAGEAWAVDMLRAAQVSYSCS